MNQEDYSPLVTLSAVTSRLVQLQSTNYTPQSSRLQAPETSAENARWMHISEVLIQCLMERVLNGDTGYFPLDNLHHDIRDSLPDMTAEELRMVAKFLSADSEFHFLDSGLPVSTRSLTRLVDHHARSDRAKLTEAGRLLYRVAGLRREWLFEDKEIEKIIRAIRNHEFTMIPDLVRNILVTFRSHSEEITRIKENASYDKLTEDYLAKREKYTETIKLSLDSLQHCMELLDLKEIQSALAMFHESSPGTLINRRYIRTMLSELIAAVESLSRNFNSLISQIQNDKTKRLGVIDFNDVLENFYQGNVNESQLTNILNDSFGWIPQSDWFSPLDLEEQLDLYEVEPIDTTVSFDKQSPQQKITSWIEQNKEFLLEQLTTGPKSLKTLLQLSNSNNLLQHIDQAFDLFSLVTTPFKLSADLSVAFKFADQFESLNIDNYKVTLSNIELAMVGRT